ncbi:phosphatidylglycerophosphatase A [Candidatus Omnitrophota bacterium]
MPRYSPFFIKLVASFFFVGYLPFFPGTFGSIAGLFIYIVLSGNIYILSFTAALIIILGFIFSGRAAKLFQHRDSPYIVIDEVSGMLVSLLGVPVDNKLILLAGLIIFRALDISKFYPAGLFQRRDTSLGIMGDDITAGIYTNLILRALLIFLL